MYRWWAVIVGRSMCSAALTPPGLFLLSFVLGAKRVTDEAGSSASSGPALRHGVFWLMQRAAWFVGQIFCLFFSLLLVVRLSSAWTCNTPRCMLVGMARCDVCRAGLFLCFLSRCCWSLGFLLSLPALRQAVYVVDSVSSEFVAQVFFLG